MGTKTKKVKKVVEKVVEKNTFDDLRTLEVTHNHRGIAEGKVVLLTDDGLAVSPDKRVKEEATDQILGLLSGVTQVGYHVVLQRSEGDGIKFVDPEGMSKGVMLVRSGECHIYCLKGNREIVEGIMKSVGIDDFNIRSNAKSDYVYADFGKNVPAELIAKFVQELPQSAACRCGHPNDKKAEAKSKVVKGVKVKKAKEEKNEAPIVLPKAKKKKQKTEQPVAEEQAAG